MEVIQERGGNPFYELSLPDAVVRLRQGFGRLMRRQDDRGAVLILDSRVVRRAYGARFLESLPPCRMASGSSGEVLAALREMFAGTAKKKSASAWTRSPVRRNRRTMPGSPPGCRTS